jgi:hypothetical protein
MKRIYLLLLIAGPFSCKNQQTCNPSSPKRIQSIYMSNCGVASYLHEIEVKGLSLKCDSVTIITLINNYINSNLSDTPINIIDMFSSKQNFDIGETLSQPNEYYKERVVRIYFDQNTNHIKTFEFFDEGITIYKGNVWKR